MVCVKAPSLKPHRLRPMPPLNGCMIYAYCDYGMLGPLPPTQNAPTGLSLLRLPCALFLLFALSRSA